MREKVAYRHRYGAWRVDRPLLATLSSKWSRFPGVRLARSRSRRLIAGISATAGRNHRGKITSYHRGGGHKRRHRRVCRSFGGDWLPSARLVSWYGLVEESAVGVSYDPARSARLLEREYTGLRSLRSPAEVGVSGVSVPVRRYRLATVGVKSEGLWNRLVGGERVKVPSPDLPDVYPGREIRLGEVPSGTAIHSLELTPGSGGRRVRAGGCEARVVNRSEGWVRVRLPSGEQRRFREGCRCVIGRVLGESHWWTRGSGKAGGVSRRWEGWSSHPRRLLWPQGKAGRTRWLGRRPTVRGTARNPIDHPHGGGQGKTSGGRPSVTPWSVPKGVRTSAGRGVPYQVITRRRAQKL